jgi:chemotaxis protein histidine kinase CheA
MTKFSPNPLKWFKKKTRSKASLSPGQPALLKARAKPRKSGDIFMHLITIQKSLRSLELSMRQKIDFSWLVQKITGQLAILKLEAETVDEEELAAVAGQVEAYFETVAEGRLDFDEKGLAVMLEFTNIYKNALGDTVSDQPDFHQKRLEGWNESYQALMANMRPSFEEAPAQTEEVPMEGTSAKVHEIRDEELEPFDEQLEETYETPSALELTDAETGLEFAGYESDMYAAEEPATLDLDEDTDEIGALAEFIEQISEEPAATPSDFPMEDEIPEEEPEDIVEEPSPVVFETPADFASSLPEDEIDAIDNFGDFDIQDEGESESEDEIPLYDPSDELQVRDVVISDAEIKSAREYMELGEDRPKVREPVAADSPPPHEHDVIEKSPVQLEEVERLKSKLSELHEKQEMLSTKMSSILGDYKKAVQTEPVGRDLPAVEDLDLEDLEDIIFIGRDKG